MQEIDLSLVVVCNCANDYLTSLIKSLDNQSDKNFSLLIVSNEPINKKCNLDIFNFVIDEIEPSIKRNLALDKCKTNYVTFLDDDTECPEDFIRKIKIYAKRYNFFGGPGILPNINVSNIQKLIYYTQITSASFTNYRYYKSNKIFKVNELHSLNFTCNLSRMKNLRFDISYWPGEDTKFFFEINQNNSIYFIGENYVYHHPRNSLFKYMRQINRFGFFRIKLMKNNKEYFSLIYLIPLFFFFLLGFIPILYFYFF